MIKMKRIETGYYKAIIEGVIYEAEQLDGRWYIRREEVTYNNWAYDTLKEAKEAIYSHINNIYTVWG